MNRILEFVLVMIVLIIAVAFLIPVALYSRSNVMKMPTGYLMNTSYRIDNIKITKSGDSYHYHVVFEGAVMSSNTTTVMPVIYYKYHYFKCNSYEKLHLKKGKPEYFKCVIDFDTYYSPIEKKCSGSLNRHETIECGKIAFMIEDVIDLHSETNILWDMAFHPKGVQYWYAQYLRTLENILKNPIVFKSNDKLPNYAALVAIDDGNAKTYRVIEYDRGCEQCYSICRQPGPNGVMMRDKFMGCNDADLKQYLEKYCKSHDTEVKNECRGRNKIEIQTPGYDIKLNIKSAEYFKVSDMLGPKFERKGFDSFEMETEGGSFENEKAPLEIDYLAIGCPILEAASTSNQIYRAMNECKAIKIMKTDRIWVADVLSPQLH